MILDLLWWIFHSTVNLLLQFLHRFNNHEDITNIRSTNMNIEELLRLSEQGRCLHCKKRTIQEMVTCHSCLEAGYCSIECLETDEEKHKALCDVISLRKGRRVLIDPELGGKVTAVRHKAMFMDDKGDLKPRLGEREQQAPARAHQSQRTDQGQGSGKKKHRRHRGKRHRNTTEAGIAKETEGQKAFFESVEQGTGKFGGPAKCSEEDKSGADFGTGWMKCVFGGSEGKQQRSTDEPTKCSEKDRSGADFGGDKHHHTTEGSSSSTGNFSHKDQEAKGPPARNKYAQLYDDSDSSDSNDVTASPKDGANTARAAATKEKKDDADTARAAATKEKSDDKGGLTSPESTQLVLYDPKRAAENARKLEKTTGHCRFCKKHSYNLKTCSRCKFAKYCNKDCQTKDFKGHKELCRRTEEFEKASKKVFRTGLCSEVQVSFLDGLIPEAFAMFGFSCGRRTPVLAKITGPGPHLFRYGAFIEDVYGNTIHVLFYTNTPYYCHREIEGSGLLQWVLPQKMVHLRDCLNPGNFIVLLQPILHNFLDGTQGIRIDDMETEVRFVFQ